MRRNGRAVHAKFDELIRSADKGLQRAHRRRATRLRRVNETAFDRVLKTWAEGLLGGPSASVVAGKQWHDIAREKQLPPPGEWFVWLLLAGRGFGKSRTGGEWLDERARSKAPGQQVLIAGRTPSDVRDYLLHGPGGILTHHPDVVYEPSNRALTWPNGVVGLIRSGANPEEFRGYSGDTALLDEFMAWDYPEECWNNLIFGMREGDPKIAIMTTPRPLPVLKRIRAMPGVVVVVGDTQENEANLSAVYIRSVVDPLRGTRLGRQELGAEVLEDLEGALWRLADIDRQRRKVEDLPRLLRVVVGVDPQGTRDVEAPADRTTESYRPSSETGIIAAALGEDLRYYVLEDGSINGTPNQWGTRAVAVYDRQKADRVVGEKNFGGEMVEHTVRTVREDVAFDYVVASRGKRQRAEPVAALYEQGRVSHVGSFAALEDEMCSFMPESGWSPNRMDALVWALTYVQVEGPPKKRRLVW